jgi:FkbM family methyltransferase
MIRSKGARRRPVFGSSFELNPVRSLGRRALEGAARRTSVSVRRRKHVPFGVRWCDDLAYYLGSQRPCHFIDVGAHEGHVALQFNHSFPNSEIHAFEPMPGNFEKLAQNLEGTGAVLVNAAVGRKSGRATLFEGESSETAGFGAVGRPHEVAVVSLDEYSRDGIDSTIDLLKIDTEGHELPVLEGASNLLERGLVKHILCECDFDPARNEPHGNFQHILAFLQPRNFRVVAFYCGGVDDVGWHWGDVLFRYSEPTRLLNPDPGRISGSPFRKA